MCEEYKYCTHFLCFPAASFSIDHRPFPANISGIPPHDAIEHGHETDDDISIDELTLDEFQIAISKDEEDGPPFSLELVKYI